MALAPQRSWTPWQGMRWALLVLSFSLIGLMLYRNQATVTILGISFGIAYVLDPTLFDSQERSVAVEIQSELTRGQTVVDFQHQWGNVPNARVCLEVDSTRLLAMYLARITAP